MPEQRRYFERGRPGGERSPIGRDHGFRGVSETSAASSVAVVAMDDDKSRIVWPPRFGGGARVIARVFDHAAEGMMITDTDGVILTVNSAFLSLTGFAAADVVGKSCRRLRSDLDDDGAFSAFWHGVLETGRWRGQARHRCRDDRALLDWLSYTVVPDDDGQPHVLVSFGGVSVLHHQEVQIGLLVHHDALTGLPNRIHLFDRLKDSLHHTASGRSAVAVLFLDIDNFKLVNDGLGHDVGDRMLVVVARRLKGSVGRAGTVARMGGDEFVVVLNEFESLSELAGIAENLLAQLLEPVYFDGHVVHITASIGISVFPHGGGDARTLLQNAETAMYRVKERGRNAYDFFDPSLKCRAAARLDLQADLRRAAENREFVLHYQPKIALADRSVLGCEALIRWRHPTAGMIAPGEFIPLAEETGLIVPIGLWALRTACEQSRRWSNEGIGDVKVAVNLSARQFRQADLIERIRDIVTGTALPPEHLEIELTESTVMDDAEQAIRVMRRLRDMGIRISVDDFGTGYSSLSYLKKLPLNTLKIDRSFITDVVTDADDAAIVNTIISLGRILRLEVVAEGIETEQQLTFLQDHECAVGQGYYFAFPLSAVDFGEWMRGKKSAGRRKELDLPRNVGIQEKHHD